MSWIWWTVAALHWIMFIFWATKYAYETKKRRDRDKDPWVDRQQVLKTPSTLRWYEADYARRSSRTASGTTYIHYFIMPNKTMKALTTVHRDKK